MSRHAIANRTVLINLFEKMISTKIDKRILCIEAHTDHGKSVLSNKLAHIADDRLGTGRCAITDFKEGQHIEAIMSELADQLAVVPFTHFRAALDRLRPGGTAIFNVDMKESDWGNDNSINVGATLESDDRLSTKDNDRIRYLSREFIRDLSNHHGPLVIILDSFEREHRLQTNWVIGSLLPVVRRHEHLVFVIAGQQTISVQNHHIAWSEYLHFERLSHVRSSKDWHEFACTLHPLFPHDSFFEELCSLLFEQPTYLVYAIQRRIQQLFPN